MAHKGASRIETTGALITRQCQRLAAPREKETRIDYISATKASCTTLLSVFLNNLLASAGHSSQSCRSSKACVRPCPRVVQHHLHHTTWPTRCLHSLSSIAPNASPLRALVCLRNGRKPREAFLEVRTAWGKLSKNLYIHLLHAVLIFLLVAARRVQFLEVGERSTYSTSARVGDI